MSQESMRFPIQPQNVHAASGRSNADLQHVSVERNRARRERDRKQALLDRFRGKPQ